MGNTGNKIYGTLIEIDNETGLPTGNTKPNAPGDPDYIPPTLDLVECPTTTTTTVITNTIQVKIKNNSLVFVNFSELKVKWSIAGTDVFSFVGLIGPGGSVDGSIAPVVESHVDVLMSCTSSADPYMFNFECKDTVGMIDISTVNVLLTTPIVGATFTQTISPTGVNIYTITIEDGEVSTTSTSTTTTSTTTSTTTTSSTTTSTSTTTTTLPTTGRISAAVASDVNSETSIVRIVVQDEATSSIILDTAVALDYDSAPFTEDGIFFRMYSVTIYVSNVIGANSLVLDSNIEQLLDVDGGVRDYTFTNVELDLANPEAFFMLCNSTGEEELLYVKIEEVERKTVGYIYDNEITEEVITIYKVQFFEDANGSNPKTLTKEIGLRFDVHYEEDNDYSEDSVQEVVVGEGVLEQDIEFTTSIKVFDYSEEAPLVLDAQYTYTLIEGNNYRIIQHEQ